MILACPQCGAKFAVDDAALGATGRRVRCSACRHEWRAAPPQAGAAAPPMDALPVASPAPEPAPSVTPDMIVPMAIAASAPAELERATPTMLSDAIMSPTAQPPIEGPPVPAQAAPPRPVATAARPAPAAPTRRARRSSGGWIVFGWALLLLVVAPAVGAVMMREPIVCRFPETQSIYAYIGIPSSEATEGLIVVGSNVTTETRDSAQVLIARAEISNVGNCTRIVPLRGVMVDAAGRSRGEALFTAAAPVLRSGESTTIRVEIRSPPAAVTGMVLPDLRHAGR